MDGPKGERSESSRDFEAVKALDSSFRWNDEQKFPAIEDLKFGALTLTRPCPKGRERICGVLQLSSHDQQARNDVIKRQGSSPG